MSKKIEKFEQNYTKKDIPKFNVGDTVQVYSKIKEEGKARIQLFEGTVIREKGKGLNKTFTVRRVSYGEGVERIFLLHSPNIDRIKIAKKGKVKRAKLYYLREKIGKKTKVEDTNIFGTKAPAAKPEAEAAPPREESAE